MTTEIARFMRELEAIWDEHVEALVVRRDVPAAMASMTAEPSLQHLPTLTSASGRAELARFYSDALLTHLPADLSWTRRSRTVDRFRLVDEVTVSFLHDRELPWLLPGISPTGRHASATAIVIVEFQRGLIASVRTLWDAASLGSQLGVTIGPPDQM